jgi:uncharacterized protein YndB with AHSA1/START domain
MMDTSAAGRVLELTHFLDAPPEEVFAAWIEPAQFSRWFAPEGLTLPHHSLDVRPGGSWSATMRQPDGTDLVVSGRYREIDRPRKLVFTWAWHADGKRGHETEVSVELAPERDGTRLVLTQRNFATTGDRDMHHEGWGSSLENLRRLVAR